MLFVKMLKKRFTMRGVTEYQQDPDFAAFSQGNLHLYVDSIPLTYSTDNIQVRHDKKSIDGRGIVNEMTRWVAT